MKNEFPSFSFYKAPISNNIPNAKVSLLGLYKGITSKHYAMLTEQYRAIGNPQEASRFKTSRFDYVTFCGVFSKRKDASIIIYSGYMVLDIDKQPDVDPIQERLIGDTMLDPQLIFKSPSGKGLKVVIAYDISSVQHAREFTLTDTWQSVNIYLKQRYSDIIQPDQNGNFIDPSGRDLSRACFICYDPNCFINDKFFKNDNQRFYK